MTDTHRPRLHDHGFPAPRRAALRALLVETASASRPAAPYRPRSRILIGGVAAITLVGGGGAIALSQLGSSSVSDRQSARCYSEASYSPGDKFPGTTIGQPNSATGSGQVDSAIEVCAALWRAGILQPGVPTAVPRPDKAAYPVPQLVACVLPDGRAAVFPGAPGLCLQMNLAAATPAPSPS
jgi:hypothetical protein